MAGPGDAQRYYEEHAQAFFDRTVMLPMTAVLAHFVGHVRAGGAVLDAGCGSGRDALTLHQLGFAVSAFDASAALASLATEHTGLPVERLAFAELTYDKCFDGIWACASLVHLPPDEMAGALANLVRALKPGGILYVSLKEGSEHYVDSHGRYFNRYSQEKARSLLESAGLFVRHSWPSTHVGDPGTTWVNVIAHKVDSLATSPVP